MEPNHPGNDGSRFCQSCGSELVLQQRYRVMRLISDKSGFGKVYEAYERNVPKILKVLKDQYNRNSKAVELFQQEAAVLSHLRHPGIPLIEPNGYFQFVPRSGDEPLHCLIMEKIDGPNLREWMRQQGKHPISERQALNWLHQLAQVLHLVHQRNYFHRDIKPENIMLRSSGQLVLVDFGAAREMTYTYLAQLGGDSGVTRISSAGYTPPEQEHGQAVPQSDFYALGRTFIYLLTGKLPTDANIYDAETNEFHWRHHAPDISPKLADFIDRLIAPKVSDRPKNTHEILDAVDHLIQELAPQTAIPDSPLVPTQINRSTVLQTLTRWGDDISRRTGWSVMILSLLLIVGLAGYGGWRMVQRAIAPASSTEDVTSTRTLSGHTGKVNTMTLSPNRTILISGGADNNINLWSIQTGSLVRTLSGHDSFINAVVVSPDGQNILSGGADRTIRIWDAQTGMQLQTLEGHQSFVNALVITPNGRQLISGSADGEIRLWNLQTGETMQIFQGHTTAINALVVSHDGKRLFSGDAAGRIEAWNLSTGEAEFTLQHGDGPVNALVVSPNNQTLISGGADAAVRIWNVSSQQETQILNGHTSYINDLLLSDDGEILVSSSADQTVKFWELDSGGVLTTLTGFDGPVNDIVLDATWNTLITSGESANIYIWQLPDSLE
jgi:WD40 repeat protein/predicted Ser/Thr protein kinase